MDKDAEESNVPATATTGDWDVDKSTTNALSTEKDKDSGGCYYFKPSVNEDKDNDESNAPAISASEDKDVNDVETLEPIDMDSLRVKLESGTLRIGKYEDDIHGTFPFSALAVYSKVVSEGLEQHGEDTFFRIPFEMTEDMNDPNFISTFWWQTKQQQRPALDYPFAQLFTMMVELHRVFEEASPDGDASAALPMRPTITTEASILQIAKMYWSAKQLKIQRPMEWDKTLRTLLLKKIRAIDPSCSESFRGSDFWYVWSVFRGSDDEVSNTYDLVLAGRS
jgi:hypothetical protein